MTATLLNVGTVLVGSSVGLVLGERLPERIRETVLMGLGLLTVVIGIQMALKTANILILLGSTLLGGVVGEGLNIQGGLDRLGAALQARFPGRAILSERFGKLSGEVSRVLVGWNRGFALSVGQRAGKA